MRVPDISVSRLHAELVYKHRTFYLEDLESKFGTLLLMHKPFRLSPETQKKALRIQISRTCFTINALFINPNDN